MFSGCASLTKLPIHEGVEHIGAGAFSGCTSLKKIELPMKVTLVWDEAFSGCTALPSVTGIADNAFDADRNPGLKTVYTFGDFAFSSCTNLIGVSFKGNAPRMGAEVFRGVALGCYATVTKGSTGWGVTIPGTWQGIKIAYPGTLYAISFNGNGGTGTMADQICVRDIVYNLAKCAFTEPSGKPFKGWAGSNGRRYDDGVLVFNAAAEGATLTLTAIWE